MKISDSLAEMWVIHAKIEELADNLSEMKQYEKETTVITIIEEIIKNLSSLKVKKYSRKFNNIILIILLKKKKENTHKLFFTNKMR
jgi:hypothetical protein